jgi:hypothetical protein
MKKNYFIGLLLIAVALIAVSCSADKAVQDELVSVSFEKLQARAIDSNYYTVSSSADISNAQVQVGNVGDYYWSYKATKKNGGFTSGQTTEFMAWATDNGLSNSKYFSKGSWVFEFKAYATADARTAGTNPIFSGSAGTSDSPISLTGESQTVAVSMTHAGTTGNATADISVTAKLVQDVTNYEGTASKISAIKIKIGDSKTITLTKSEEKDNNDFYTWTGNDATITNGTYKVTMEVYIDEDSSATYTKELEGVAFMYGLTTKIEGTATITATAKDDKVSVTFTATMPSYQSKSTIVQASTIGGND